MAISADSLSKDFDPRFKVFHELMPNKIRKVLLVSTPYDAWIMEADCRLSEKIINEYRGLNLSHPQRLNWVSSTEEAFAMIQQKQFDLVITNEGFDDFIEVKGLGGHATSQSSDAEVTATFSRSEMLQLAILQLRPVTEVAHKSSQGIDDELISKSFCYSTRSLGSSDRNDIEDILYVPPETFDPAKTKEIAGEIGRFNAQLTDQDCRYLLVGPGRWGSADPWLGIPVRWADISGVAAIIETCSDKLKAEPSQGSHFFHNIIALGINYITVHERGENFLDWEAIRMLPIEKEGKFVVHAKLSKPLGLTVDGVDSSTAVWSAQA